MVRSSLLALALLATGLAGCAQVADQDGDGLDDAAELEPRDLRITTARGTETRTVTSDPARRDTDGDGLTDQEELEGLTDPSDVDTDADGLLDGRDLVVPQGSALHNLLASRAIARGPDGRFLGEADAGTRPFHWDSDRPLPDGLGDGDELRGWNVTLGGTSYHVTSDPRVPDTERDHLNDFEERRRGCDPLAADADQDKVPDPVDADCARDVRVRVAVTQLELRRSLDASGGADLHIVAQSSGLQDSFTQAVREGPNEVAFSWSLDVPDQGSWRNLTVPVELEFWDQDLAGDDPQSGVSRQPLRVVGDGNALGLVYDVFADRWQLRDGRAGAGPGSSEGTDGAVRFLVEALAG